jgi:hypothetical protein
LAPPTDAVRLSGDPELKTPETGVPKSLSVAKGGPVVDVVVSVPLVVVVDVSPVPVVVVAVPEDVVVVDCVVVVVVCAKFRDAADEGALVHCPFTASTSIVYEP